MTITLEETEGKWKVVTWWEGTKIPLPFQFDSREEAEKELAMIQDKSIISQPQKMRFEQLDMITGGWEEFSL